MNTNKFTVGVEKLVRPIDVGSLHLIQNITGALPKKLQHKMIAKSSKKTPYMGFVVEPYSYFLAYELTNLEKAQSLLPEGFQLIQTKIHQNDNPKYYGIFGIFNAHTSGFWGLRVEFYIIAENTKTGLLSWIIIDYDTNTIGYEPKDALVSANAEGSIFTIDYDGIIHVDVNNTFKNRKLIFESDIKQGVMTKLDNRLWVEGNLSIGYGKDLLGNTDNVFSLMFDPNEFTKALVIDEKDLMIRKNTWFTDMIEEKPAVALCFPYAQHFLSDSPGHASHITNQEQLEEEIKTVDFNQIEVFSTKPIKKMMLFGVMISTLINIVLLTLLLI